MKQPAKIIQRLRELAQFDAELSNLHRDTKEYLEMQDRIESLRAPLPTLFLGHYDGRKARGQLAIAAVRRGVCAACHLAIPSGRLADLRRNPGGLNVCDNCGVFIYWTEDQLPPSSGSTSNQIPDQKARKTKRAHSRRG